VRFLGIVEDDASAGITLVRVAPDIPVARVGTRFAAPRPLEPGMLIGRVVDHEFSDDAQSAPLRLLHEAAKFLHGPEVWIDTPIIGDVVAVVTTRRWIERQQPQGGDAEVLQIIKAFRQSGEIANAVIVAIGKSLDVKLVDDGVLIPKLVSVEL